MKINIAFSSRMVMFCLWSLMVVFGMAAEKAEAQSASEAIHCRLDITVEPTSAKVKGIMEIADQKSSEVIIYPNMSDLHVCG
jgi:hypothetical protein